MLHETPSRNDDITDGMVVNGVRLILSTPPTIERKSRPEEEDPDQPTLRLHRSADMWPIPSLRYRNMEIDEFKTALGNISQELDLTEKKMLIRDFIRERKSEFVKAFVEFVDAFPGETRIQGLLHEAIRHSAYECVKVLLRSYDKNELYKGFTPLGHAAQYKEMKAISYLDEGKRADRNILCNTGETDHGYIPPFFFAAQHGNQKMLELLKPEIYSSTADYYATGGRAQGVNYVSLYGDTALHLAVRKKNFTGDDDFLDSVKTIRLLLEWGVDKSIENKEGETAFEVALYRIIYWCYDRYENFKQWIDFFDALLNPAASSGGNSTEESKNFRYDLKLRF